MPVSSPRPTDASTRRRARWLAAAAALVVVVGGAAALLVAGRRPPPEPRPSVVEEQVEAWRAAGLVPAGGVDPAGAAARLAAAREALAADLPARGLEALRAAREAIALAPAAADGAVAVYALAFAEAAGEEPDGAEVRAAHALVRDARSRAPARPDLLAAWARLLLLAPGEANAAEARDAAAKALAAAADDVDARLALGLARLGADPAAAARTLEEGLAAEPARRRLLVAAARARWAAGDAAAALAHVEARLALEPGHPGALALRAEIELASDRLADGRATLARWEAAEPGSALPPLLLARLAYQRDGDLPLARRLLEAALARRPGAFTAARALAHRAAVERAAGDEAAARAAAEEALRLVPGSAPARFQAALLAARRRDAPALRESAGVLHDRAGRDAALLLAALGAELGGTDDEAQLAWRAVADAAPGRPEILLSAAGALARLRAPGPALQLARRALERDPAEARLARAPTDFWVGPADLADAAGRLEAIGRAEPSAAETAFAAAAACELLLGRTRPAERLAWAASAAAPQAAAPPALLAQVALDRGDARRALAHAQAAADSGAPGGATLAIRARALEALGRRADAERSLRAALEARPDLASARLALARLLAGRGERGEAGVLLAGLVRDAPDLTAPRGALLALPGGPAAAAP